MPTLFIIQIPDNRCYSIVNRLIIVNATITLRYRIIKSVQLIKPDDLLYDVPIERNGGFNHGGLWLHSSQYDKAGSE